MKYFFVVGEKSGDLHAGNLIKELKKINPESEIYGWGGDYMKSQGAIILKDYKELAFMGFWEVFKKIFIVLNLFKEIKKQITEINPDQIVLVDYAGFNMRIAKWAFQKGIFVNYYIAPKTWAWQQSRTYKIKKYVNRLLVIFPFEKDFFEKYGIETHFVGNPLIDHIESFKKTQSNLSDGISTNVALLPGSRKQEISYALPIFNELAKEFPDIKFTVAAVDDFGKAFYETLGPNLNIDFNNTYSILQKSQAAIVTSGTATLETALFNVPQIVVYRTNNLTYTIAKYLVKIKFISLVNIILDKKVVLELIQENFNVQMLKIELTNIIFDIKYRNTQLDQYKILTKKLGNAAASKNAAEILNTIK